MINIKNYDFLDFGASKGASIEFAKKKLFGKKGLGVDLDPKRVKIMQDAGYDCTVGDITALDLPAKSVRFVKMSHILDHMPDLEGVKKAVASAKKVATDFLVITGPYFDEDKYLRSIGFKLDWSDYPEHTCHLTVAQLVGILETLELNNYELYLRYKIEDSTSPRIHPLDSPPGSHNYNPKVHSPKKQVNFDKDIWTDFVCYVRLSETKNWDKVKDAYREKILYIHSDNNGLEITPNRVMSSIWNLYKSKKKDEEKIIEMKQYVLRLKEKNKKLENHLEEIQGSSSWKLAKKLSRARNSLRKSGR